jgi:hypothetical protein
MAETYPAILQGDHIEWTDEAPRRVNTNARINVIITIPGETQPASSGQTTESGSEAEEDEMLFRRLAEQWRSETQYFSTLPKMVLHPAYQKIIGFGKPAVPLILKELEARSDPWLWALHAITGEDPAPPNATFSEAVQAWLAWGRRKGHLK